MSRNRLSLSPILHVAAYALCLTLSGLLPALALEDTSKGVCYAPQTERPPVIDGNPGEWDERLFNTVALDRDVTDTDWYQYAFQFDDENLYVCLKVADQTPMRNAYLPGEMTWRGDLPALRMASKPMKLPSNVAHGAGENKDLAYVHWISLWRNLDNGKDYIEIVQQGANPKKEVVTAPSTGATCAFSIWADGKGYNCEAKIPWKLLNVEGPGISAQLRSLSLPMAIDLHYSIDANGRQDGVKLSANYRSDPGMWGFLRGDLWGEMVLKATGETFPAAAKLTPSSRAAIEIAIPVKDKGMVSCNIRDEKGDILRSLIKEDANGPSQIVRWDGKDRFGKYVRPGSYRYDTLSAPALQARYVGAVGSSGTPPYETPDALGGWGSDLNYPHGVASDSTGVYFLWMASDASGCTLVKLTHDGKTQWRTRTPAPDASFGNYSDIVSDGTCVYIVSGALPGALPRVMCVDPATGCANQTRMLPLSGETRQPAIGVVAPGIAISKNRGYVSLFFENKIKVFELSTLKIVGELALDRPHGLCVGADGNLYAISRGGDAVPPKIVVFRNGTGAAEDFITEGLDRPAHLACFSDGTFLVSDPGAQSNQLKFFSADGRKLLRTMGRAGGRPWMGAYEPENFLRPWRVTVLADDSFLVAEEAPPGVISKFSKDGQVLKRWFGPPGYGASCFAFEDKPFDIFYGLYGESLESHNARPYAAFARASLDEKTGAWSEPAAYWCPAQAGWPQAFHLLFGNHLLPITANGRRYVAGGGSVSGLMELRGDRLVPTMSISTTPHQRHLKSELSSYATDADGAITGIDRKSIPRVGGSLFCLNVQSNLDVYYQGENKCIVRIPFGGIDAQGTHHWDVDNTRTVIADFAPGVEEQHMGGDRHGVCGIRVDRQGNLYVAWAAGPASQGLYWSASLTQTRVSKFDSTGKLLWEAGNKAMSRRKDGEIYNFWMVGGLFDDDKYLAIGDEASMIHYFTADGFYRGHVLNDLASGQRGPYTGSFESFSQAQTFKDRKTGIYYAYRGLNTAPCMYEVTGFGGETRGGGVLDVSEKALAEIMDGDSTAPRSGIGAISQITSVASIKSIPWEKLTPALIVSGVEEKGRVYTCFDSANLYVRFDLNVPRPLANQAQSPEVLFAGGDSVSLYFGPTGSARADAPGTCRVMAAPRQDGSVRIIGLKPKTGGGKKPYTYKSDTRQMICEWLDEILGATGAIEKTKNGTVQSLVLQIPLAFFEEGLFRPNGKLRVNYEMTLSDSSGKRASERYWAAPPSSANATLVNEILSNAVFYPESWQETPHCKYIE